MRALARVSLSSLMVVLAMACTGLVRADAPTTEKGTGTITGRVVDADGKPVAGAHVRAFDAEAIRQARQKNKDNPGGATAPRPKAVAKTDTGADGTFTLENVPAGKIRLMAGLQGTGIGMVREPVNVKAGDTEKVGDIKLRKPPAGGPGAGGGRNKPNGNPPQQ